VEPPQAVPDWSSASHPEWGRLFVWIKKELIVVAWHAFLVLFEKQQGLISCMRLPRLCQAMGARSREPAFCSFLFAVNHCSLGFAVQKTSLFCSVHVCVGVSS
jgi:hypothetical protein